MVTQAKKITVSKELKEFIVPLAAEEFELLRKSIIADGCREPLIVWQTDDNRSILIDGHNRYQICTENDIPFQTKKLKFADIDEVKIWMVNNQMGRRNLSSDQMSYYRGLKYLALKKKKGGYANVQAKGSENILTSELVADEFSVSESTVKRDAKFAEGLNLIQRSNPKLKLKILSGEVKVKKADIQVISNSKNASRLSFRNEADLHNKAKQIREEIIKDVEREVLHINDQTVAKAKETLDQLSPVFSSTEDRLKRLKGMIISAINKAINQKDAGAIKELKKLIDKLADELFD